jgi:hypothetical protein
MNCPDFSRDITLKAAEDEEPKEAKKEEKKPKKGLWPI